MRVCVRTKCLKTLICFYTVLHVNYFAGADISVQSILFIQSYPPKDGKKKAPVHCQTHIWVFPKIGVPQNGWFIMETPIKIPDLGEFPPILGSTPIWRDICVSKSSGYTLPEANIAPEKMASLKGKDHLPTISLQGAMVPCK